MYKYMNGGGRSTSLCRNCIDRGPVLASAAIGTAVITVFIIIANMVMKESKTADTFNAGQETNVNLYFTDGASMSGGEFVDAMYKLSGTSVCFSVRTLSSDEPAYYNRDADGSQAPVYTEPSDKAVPEYIRNLGVFEIHISTGENGQKIVSATQTK